MIATAMFEEEGFAMTEGLLSSAEIRALLRLIESTAPQHPSSPRGGVRDIMEHIPALRELADRKNIREIVEDILGPQAFLVRSTLFDKTDAANWKVPWHQDITIAVSSRTDAPGYGPWSIKVGVLHVQPPTKVLRKMLTIRIHLDDCPATNGALRVQPGTHRLGRLNQNHVEQHIDEAKVMICAASAGEALVMRPLLLHASSASETPGHRRVVHFDFAVGELAAGIAWKMR